MARGDDEAASQKIVVPSEDPVKKPEQNGTKEDAPATDKGKGKDGKPTKEAELSEEDLQLKNELEMLVERLKEDDQKLYRPALESLRTLIRTSTSSMTSVPKPLKFLRPHYNDLKEILKSWPSQSVSTSDQSLFSEILSVLAMTYADNGNRETLSYRLEASQIAGAQAEDPGLWGNEYVRHLVGEIGEEYNIRLDKGEDTSELLELGLLLVPFSLKHNAEADAVDLLLELEAIDRLPPYVEQDTFARVCRYMVSCVNLLVPPDDKLFLRTAREIYRKHGRYAEAMILAMRLQDKDAVRDDFFGPTNYNMQRQLAYMLGRHLTPAEWVQMEDELLDQDLMDCIYNTNLSQQFINFGKELSVSEPRSLEDIYKSHLEPSRSGVSSTVDSARGNLASTFVNAFVNAGFGNDKLMVAAEEGNSWIYKNKDHGMMSAAASLGMSLIWDAEGGLSHIDKYTYSSDENIKAGALLAYGILHASVRTEMDAALALLSEHVESGSSNESKIAAIVGLGIAYCGAERIDIVSLLLPLVQDETTPMDIASMAALSLGLIWVGSGHMDVAPAILQTLMEREPSDLDSKWTRFMILGLALLYFGQQDHSDAIVEISKTIEHPVGKQAEILVHACSYAGTGDVLQIQSMLHHCTEHIGADSDKAKESEGANGSSEENKDESKDKPSDAFQGFAVLAIGLIAMGEDIGSEMVIRHMGHLMHYGEPSIRRAVPLALGLLNPSNPAMSLLDTLSKYSHDSDLDVAINAIFAMGLVGAGTNNARLAQMLRGLASYYAKEPDCLFVVRVAQGLIHMGKGTIGLNPIHTDRQLISGPAVAGLLATLVAFTDSRAFILDKSHWMLFFLANAMHPRFLVTLDEDLKPLPTSVRVGKAVDTVGLAGAPRTISGFQTHTTPVRMGVHERAELATEEYLAYSPILEGIVILAKNPGYQKED